MYATKHRLESFQKGRDTEFRKIKGLGVVLVENHPPTPTSVSGLVTPVRWRNKATRFVLRKAEESLT